jgi:type IV secretory pathway VirJ component
MTTKQIAEAVGQTERSVQMWAKKAAEKISSINEKISLSSSRYPADYDINEVCQIIEEGMGKAAADVYRTNAVNAELAGKAKALPATSESDWRRIRELLRAVDHKALSPVQFQAMIGAPMERQEAAEPKRTALPAPTEAIATDAQAAQVFNNIRSLPMSDKARRAGFAAAKNVADREAIKVEADRKQGRLGI